MNKYSLVFYLTILAFFSLKAQINTYSPYSYFGLGDVSNYYNAANNSMGGLGVTNTSSMLLNYINPATYSSLNQTLFEIGVRSSSFVMSQDNLEQKNFISGLLNLGFGFPISDKIGVTTALLPYSSVGYNVSSEVLTNDEIGLINYIYSGSGGINRFLFGTGVQITNNISVGLNWNYFFGSIHKTTDIYIDNIVTKFKEEEVTYISDFNFELGLLLTQKINQYDLNIGATMSPKKEMKSTSRVFQHTYYTSGNYETPIDTIMDVSIENDNILMPLHSSVGVSVGSENKWLVGLDYRYTNWAEYSSINSDYSYKRDKNEIIFGARFTPKKKDIHNYFNQIEYRFGFSYGSGYLDLAEAVNLGDINGTTDDYLMEDIAISFGMGLPINKMSSIANIGLKYQTRINTDINIINERSLTIYFSMTLNEKWFKKRKIE